MFADELMRMERAYALDSNFAKEIRRTTAEGRKSKHGRAGIDPNTGQKHVTGSASKFPLKKRIVALRDKLSQQLKEEYTREYK